MRPNRRRRTFPNVERPGRELTTTTPQLGSATDAIEEERLRMVNEDFVMPDPWGGVGDVVTARGDLKACRCWCGDIPPEGCGFEIPTGTTVDVIVSTSD